ncbi:PREDICTED: uncharacterized protein LOC105620917 [Atta cephalotes]|uniref:Uncharacterized protein n=1 Tax=Atta cephalotes TaxID=12957 RepID=A0A158NJS5_ATTCE|nr:PREDICTED: uncharacterized protein LOC105620917 [Atta cephalotes]
MDEIIFDQTTIEDMTVMLTMLQQQYGQLKLFSSRALQQNSCFIDEILRIITSFLGNRLRMYDIKISSDLKRKSSYLSTFAKCYNYLLLNTNFTSQSLLKHDLLFGHAVGIWPTLSPYLFIQIIWHSKCEDLLIESLIYIPLDLCVEILDITFKHISELTVTRAKRFIFHLIYKLYNKCLWLHLGTISAENVTKSFQKLLMLTYGNYYNNYAKYHQTFPVSEIKSIIVRLDHKLATVLLNQIKCINYSEYRVWKSVYANEITVISLHRSIIIDCHDLKEFMKQNDFLIKNEQTYFCLKRLIDSRKSEEYILTIQELCHRITEGKLHGMKELIMRYEEWELSKKYQVYVSVLKILNHLKEHDLHFVILKYMKQHFDDNCLEDLYNEKSFDAFIWRNLLVEKFNDSQSMRNAIAQRCRSFLIFILLNPKADRFRVEPLDITKAWHGMNALNIIQEYEKRYVVICRQLRVNPRCHPELRNYVQSFSLDREAFIRHMILHCIGEEYTTFMCDLILIFWYYLGWTDEMMAYENIMRITIDVSQIALMYYEMFPKDTFVMLLFAIVHLSRNVAKKFVTRQI